MTKSEEKRGRFEKRGKKGTVLFFQCKKTVKNRTVPFFTLSLFCNLCFGICNYSFAQETKFPNVSGAFYPDNPKELSTLIDNFLNTANPEAPKGQIFALILPHAGYSFSGQVAGFGYKLVRTKPYKTVIIIGPSHQYGFSGVSVWPEGKFNTPLGDLAVDKGFAQKLLNKYEEISFEPKAFQKEHSVEVQLPFLQRALTNGSTSLTISAKRNKGADFKIVPIVMGDTQLETCQKLAALLKAAIGKRNDVLVIASSDMYHGYDYDEADRIDAQTLNYLQKMDADGLYYGLREAKLQLCGGFPVVTTLILAKGLGHNKLDILNHTNSCAVTGNMRKGIWTVGYASCVIDIDKEGEPPMLNNVQRKKLLEIARRSIETYLKTNKKLEVSEPDALLNKNMGAFVTLHKHGQLRGCIGSLIGSQPLYLTVKDMAVESAVDDPRFSPLDLSELADIEIEISALSELRRISSADEIILGTHGVIIKKGHNSGVFLPQVATETGWSKEEFLSQLCAQKAGIAADAWKDGSTEIYVFTAEVFSEKSY